MVQELTVTPGNCTGCSSCALTCSFINTGEFNLQKSNIRININEFEGVFEISFLSTCKKCKLCAQFCPSGALRIIEAHREEGEVK